MSISLLLSVSLPLTQTLESERVISPCRKVAYIRCSHTSMDLTRQRVKMESLGVSKIYEDLVTGRSSYKDRSGLSQCLNDMKPGMVLYVDELSRLGRNMVEMVSETANLLDRGCHIVTSDGRLNTLQYPEEIVKLIIAVLGYGAEMNLKDINRRCKEGAELYRAKGNHWGRKHSYTTDQAKHVMAMRSEGLGYGTIARSMGMTKSMVRRIIERFQEKQ